MRNELWNFGNSIVISSGVSGEGRVDIVLRLFVWLSVIKLMALYFLFPRMGGKCGRSLKVTALSF